MPPGDASGFYYVSLSVAPKLNGITPRLIESHYEGNYGSALRRLNAITEELEALDPATASIEVINRLKRDEREETDVLPSPADLL